MSAEPLFILHAALLCGLGLVILSGIGSLIVMHRLDPLTEPVGENAPLLSILVPARNEAACIGECVRSLKAQDYPNFEVIVLDDGSSDGTAGLVRAEGFGESGRLRLVSGAALPAGWVGKNWACHQLGRLARGEYLLFVDADTVHEPGGASALIGYSREENAGMVTATPFQVMRTLGEMLVIPIIGLLLTCFVPHWMLYLFQRFPLLARIAGPKLCASLGAANGQCILFRRADYERIGGHERVRDHLVEDLALGRLAASMTGEGMRLRNVLGSRIMRCRMYRSFREVWNGFTKNMWPAFDGNFALFVGATAVQFFCFVLPFVLLVLAPGPLALVECGVIVAFRMVQGRVMAVPFWVAFLHPFAHLLTLVIGVNSYIRSVNGGVSWKGRYYVPGAGAAE